MSNREAEFHEALIRLSKEAGTVDLRRYEAAGSESSLPELAPLVDDLLQRGIELLDDIFDHFDLEDSTGDEERDLRRWKTGDSQEAEAAADTEREARSFLRRMDSWVSSGDAVRIADLAFVGRMELRRRRSGLERTAAAGNRWALIASSGGSLRALRKGIAAVERVMAEHQGVTPAISFVSEVEIGRQVRALYAKFRREIDRGNSPTEDTLTASLTSAAASVAKLIGKDVYPEFRVSDRLELRSIRRRIRDWLAGEDDHDTDSGRHLWQDIQAFASLLNDINLRSELRDADLELLETILEQLEEEGDAQRGLSSEQLQALEGLRGRDDAIDDLLMQSQISKFGKEAVTLRMWRQHLVALRAELVASDLRGESPTQGESPVPDFEDPTSWSLQED